jgi:hypothetical protein
MNRFVQLTLIGNAGTIVAINPDHVVSAQEFAGNQGAQTTIKLVNGDTLHVRGTLADVLAQLTVSS